MQFLTWEKVLQFKGWKRPLFSLFQSANKLTFQMSHPRYHFEIIVELYEKCVGMFLASFNVEEKSFIIER